MKPLAQTRRSNGNQKGTLRKKAKSILLMVSLVPLLVTITVTVSGQNGPYWAPAEYAQPFDPFPLDEMIERYGVGEALEMYERLQQQEEARRQMEEMERARRRDRELRKKTVELVNASYKLYQRLNDPSVIHADLPELAKKCEKLAKDIKKLLR